MSDSAAVLGRRLLFQGVEEPLESGLVLVGDVERQDYGLCLSEDELSFDEAEGPRVFAVVPVVTEDEVLSWRYFDRCEAARSGVPGRAHYGVGGAVELFGCEAAAGFGFFGQIFEVLRFDFGVSQRLAVEKEHCVFHFDCVAGQGHYSLD